MYKDKYEIDFEDIQKICHYPIWCNDNTLLACRYIYRNNPKMFEQIQTNHIICCEQNCEVCKSIKKIEEN